jgi:hypothetical protein
MVFLYKNPIMPTEELKKKARNKVKAKKGFYIHFAVYMGMSLFFFLINVFDSNPSEGWWFFGPVLTWGIGIIAHYLGTFGFPGGNLFTREWEEREYEKELEIMHLQELRRLRSKKSEEPIEEKFELKEIQKQILDDQDLV